MGQGGGVTGEETEKQWSGQRSQGFVSQSPVAACSHHGFFIKLPKP
jgi:hypothetical protein